MFVRFPPNCRSSTPRRETGPDGSSSGGEYPSGAAFEARCVSRIAVAVSPVDRPDEALGTVLVDEHHRNDDRLHRRMRARSLIADHSYVAEAKAGSSLVPRRMRSSADYRRRLNAAT
jgi:hypothetical protein